VPRSGERAQLQALAVFLSEQLAHTGCSPRVQGAASEILACREALISLSVLITKLQVARCAQPPGGVSSDAEVISPLDLRMVEVIANCFSAARGDSVVPLCDRPRVLSDADPRRGTGSSRCYGPSGIHSRPKLGGTLKAAGHSSGQLFMDLLPLVVLASAAGLWFACETSRRKL
jgi:hypothetical protein